ncbi:fibronectin type III domain-containing protein [Micromonospora sp. WMMD1082]|uniref:fibronectin type III domain-containing protein n=1 Tax=Micromonospora sp. WMMD1082 TaxID=3016104 RepID=UPI00241775C8|nr:fibronectin type III domain-containing protein [Micromonospora sp. WMMD1082]MDG4796078.1 fibronectin type III domain-containing protein [Micromonospora sp. WMMD1082]
MRRHAIAISAAALALIVGVVSPSGVAAAAATAALPAPTNVRVTDLEIDSVTLAWDPVEGAVGYSVQTYGLDQGYDLPSIRTSTAGVTIPGLLWEARYQITIRALVNDWVAGDQAQIIVTTPTPDGYQPPTAPTNLRVERGPSGEIERVAWDAATGGRGTLNYVVYVDSPGFLTPGPVLQTRGLSATGYDVWVCHGCELGPNQIVIIWVRAKDLRHLSAESVRLTLHCCPF